VPLIPIINAFGEEERKEKMSVRRSSMKAASRHHGRSWGLIRSFFFWVFLLVASFAVGALIIAPLYNEMIGNHSKQPTPAASANNPPPASPPPPQSAIASPPLPPHHPQSPANLEPEIQVTPDESGTSIQPAESPDGSRPRRQRSFTKPPSVSTPNEPSSDGRSLQPEEAVVPEEPTSEPMRRIMRRPRRNDENGTPEGDRKHSNQLRRRSSEEPNPSPRLTTPPAGEIQTPEKIDP
jgi:hypothetical protein